MQNVKKKAVQIILVLVSAILVFIGTMVFSKSLVLNNLPAVTKLSSQELTFLSAINSGLVHGNVPVILFVCGLLLAISVFSGLVAFMFYRAMGKDRKRITLILSFLINIVMFLAVAGVGLFFGYRLAQNDFVVKYEALVQEIDSNPVAAGLVSSPDKIIHEVQLASSSSLKFAFFHQADATQIFVSKLAAKGEFSDFAKSNLLTIEWSKSRPAVFTTNYLLADGTLYFNTVSKSSFTDLALPLAKKLVSRTYPEMKNLPDPKMNIVTLPELKVIKNNRINDILKSLNSTVKEFTTMKSDMQKSLNTVNAQYKLYGGKGWLNLVNSYKQMISEVQVDIDTYQAQKAFYAAQLDKDPDEYGVFYPPSTIYLVLDPGYNNSVATFIPTLVHEYLHYVSYSSKSNLTKIAGIEEGLAETFTHEVMKKNFDTEIGSSYPDLGALFQQFFKDIPEESFRKNYFAQDKSAISALLIKQYGQAFYNANIEPMNQLAYSDDDATLWKTYDTILKNLHNAREAK